MLHSIEAWKHICTNCWDGIAITDQSGCITWANSAFMDITGYYECQSLSTSIPFFWASNSTSIVSPLNFRDHILDCSQWEGEVILQTRDGDLHPVSLRKQPLPKSGDTRYSLWIVRDLAQLRSLQEKMVFKENFHPLTQLPNRTYLKDHLQHCLEKAKRENTYVGLLHIDLDQFKRINTSVGHTAGDKLLIHFSRRLQNITRTSDTLLHLEGDAFAVILEKLPQSGEAGTVARRIITELSDPFTIWDKKIFVNVSIGISIYPLDANDSDSLLLHAEESMHAQKNYPESSFQYYTPQQDGAALALLRFEADLRQAIKELEFSLAFQPQIRLPDMRLRGVEALARWHSPSRGPVSPRQFIPVAEKTGLICRLGQWVLESACQTAAAWQLGSEPLSCLIAVNVSGIQFTEPGFLQQVQKALDHSGLEPGCLELEITESTILQEKVKVVRTLHALREMGVRIAIDDFGTGQSCLAILQELPVDTLKIDKKFLRNVPQCAQSTNLLKTILKIQNALELEIVAEGVETEEQIQHLKEQGCPVIQGYWFSPPLSETDFLNLCRSLNWPAQTPHPHTAGQ